MQWEGFILPLPPMSAFKVLLALQDQRRFYLRKECSDQYQHNLMASSENGFFRTDFIHLQLT